MPDQINTNGKHVRWPVFIWALGIVFLVFAIGFNVIAGLNGKVEKYQNGMTEMKVEIREIKTNTAWIMDALKKNEKLYNVK